MSPDKLSVLMLCWNFPPATGGIEHVARNIFRRLKCGGIRVQLVARFGREADEFDALRPTRPGLMRYLCFSLTAGYRELKRSHCDILLCPGIIDAPVGMLLSRLFNKPFVLLAHGSDLARVGWMYRAVTGWLFRRADGLAANSEFTRSLLLERGCDRKRIRIIHPGVESPVADTDPRSMLARQGEDARFPSGSKGPILMTAGRIIRRKGIGPFIEHVLPALLEQYPGLRYVVAGADATDSLAHQERMIDQLQVQVDLMGLSGRVHFTGKIGDDELACLYREADLFVLPVIPVDGDVEGFGIVLLEAAVARLPVVASRCGGIPDAVDDGVTGFLYPAADWPALRALILSLLGDPERMKSSGEAAYRRAHEKFTWEIIGDRYLDFLEQCARRR